MMTIFTNMDHGKILQEAESLISAGKYEEAFAYLDAAILKKPKEVSFLELYSKTTFKLGILQTAEEYADKAIRYGTESPINLQDKGNLSF